MENPRLQALAQGPALTGAVATDAPAFLRYWQKPRTAEHSAQVAAEARRIAIVHGVDATNAELAAWLHDVSAVFPGPARAEIARELGVSVLPEEEAFPPIVHQKLSAVLARELFGVWQPDVLSAIGCHTTLKAGTSALDKVVFIADKVAWDQAGTPPYLESLLAVLDRSLDDAALVYLHYLWEHRSTLAVVHPWMVDALRELSGGHLP